MELLYENKLCPMSNLSQIATEDIQTYEEFVTANYCQFAAAAYIVYEHLITIDQEIHCIWQRKFSATSAVFYLNRYLLLVWAILCILTSLSWNQPLRLSTST